MEAAVKYLLSEMSPSNFATHIFSSIILSFSMVLHLETVFAYKPNHLKIHLHILKTDTYSEMWTKISLPPSDGVMKPWPLEREKHLHMPVNKGPCDALVVLRQTTTEKKHHLRR